MPNSNHAQFDAHILTVLGGSGSISSSGLSPPVSPFSVLSPFCSGTGAGGAAGVSGLGVAPDSLGVFLPVLFLLPTALSNFQSDMFSLMSCIIA